MISRTRMLTLLSVAAAAAIGAACNGATSPRFENPAAGKPVLFIGNSLTYYNDLPILVQGIADAAGGDSLIVDMVAGPDMALVDHWHEGSAGRAIAARISRAPRSRTGSPRPTSMGCTRPWPTPGSRHGIGTRACNSTSTGCTETRWDRTSPR
jgi:hypothetical protein